MKVLVRFGAGTRVRVRRGGYAGYFARVEGYDESATMVQVRLDATGGHFYFAEEWLEEV